MVIADNLPVSQIMLVMNKTVVERLSLSAADHFDFDWRLLAKRFL